MLYQDIKLDKELVFTEFTSVSSVHSPHIHDVLEILILQSNEVYFQLPGRQIEGGSGDVFLFRPFEPHSVIAKYLDKPAKWILIQFSPAIVRSIPEGYKLLAPFYAAELVSPHIPQSSTYAQAVQQLALQALDEESEGAIGWKCKQFLLFAEILMKILRHATQNVSGGMEDTGYDDGIIKAVEYILVHFTEDINMDQIIEVTTEHRSLFYRKFKNVTGMTPNHFINRLRMQMAITLLSNTDKMIIDIALECGYHSHHYFNKHFSQFRGVSPREHRKLIQGSGQ